MAGKSLSHAKMANRRRNAIRYGGRDDTAVACGMVGLVARQTNSPFLDKLDRDAKVRLRDVCGHVLW